MADKASNKQKTLIHLAKAQLKLSEQQYRATIRMRCGGKESAKDLTYDEAHTLIEHFKRLGFKVKTTRTACSYMCAPRKPVERLPDNVLHMVSPQQIAKIQHLIEDIHWNHVDGYARWLKKYYGLDRIKYSLEASRVMEGLKGLWKTQNKCACGLAKGAR
jgi:hypothetical protein